MVLLQSVLLSICYGNEIGRLCDKIGANGKEIAQILKLEPRIGPKAMLKPGLAFSGGTLARDVQTLRSIARENNVTLELIGGAWHSNHTQKNIVLEKLKTHFRDLKNRRVAILGLTYKENTSTLRRSAAIDLFSQLKELEISIKATDPNVHIEEANNAIGDSFKSTLNETIEGVDAVILMTPCPQFKNINFLDFSKLMRGNYILDTPGYWKETAVTEAGLIYDDIGSGKLPVSAENI